MSALDNWYRRRSIDIADAKATKNKKSWEALGAAARAESSGNISGGGSADILAGADANDRLQQVSSNTRSQRIDPYKTEVFRRGPDGKLHPIEGWHTTGPFAFGEWAHNIDWGGVAQDLLTIGAAAIGRAGLPGLASRRNIVGPAGDGLTKTDKLTLGAGVYSTGDLTLRGIAPRKRPENW